MTHFDDDQDVRRSDERLLAGEPVAEEPELSALFATLRSMAAAPAPLPTPALQAVLSEGAAPREGVATTVVTVDFPRRRRVGLPAKIALGTAFAAAVATGAAALEVPATVREPAREVISSVADLLTPWAHSRSQGPVEHPVDPSDPHAGSPETPGRSDPPRATPTPAHGQPTDRTPPGTAGEPTAPAANPDDPGAPEDVGRPDNVPPEDPGRGARGEPDRGAAREPVGPVGESPYPPADHAR